GPHRYQELFEAGVEVCLGTDSILNLDTPDRISPLDDARLIYRRDGFDPQRLLSMCTSSAAAAVGLDPRRFLVAEGAELAALAAVPADTRAGDPAGRVLESDSAPELLFVRSES
ncbi:MAG: amidohydrolase family protein, partial [Planctomycetota bacterium]